MPISLCVYLLIFVYRYHHPIVIPGRSQVMHQGVHVLHGGDRLSASESLRSWEHRETNMETWHGKNMKDDTWHKMLFSCVILWLLCTLKISKDSSALTPIWRMNHQSDPEPCHIFIVTCCDMLWHFTWTFQRWLACEVLPPWYWEALLQRLRIQDNAEALKIQTAKLGMSYVMHMWCIDAFVMCQTCRICIGIVKHFGYTFGHLWIFDKNWQYIFDMWQILDMFWHIFATFAEISRPHDPVERSYCGPWSGDPGDPGDLGDLWQLERLSPRRSRAQVTSGQDTTSWLGYAVFYRGWTWNRLGTDGLFDFQHVFLVVASLPLSRSRAEVYMPWAKLASSPCYESSCGNHKCSRLRVPFSLSKPVKNPFFIFIIIRVPGICELWESRKLSRLFWRHTKGLQTEWLGVFSTVPKCQCSITRQEKLVPWCYYVLL